MPTRLFSLFAGLVYLLIGVCGFIPALKSSGPYPAGYGPTAVSTGYGMLFGWMPVNAVHGVVYVLVGVLGIVAAIAYPIARAYVRGLFFFATLLTFMGLLPWGVSRVWGLMPLYGWNVFVNAAVAITAVYFAFVYPHVREAGPEPV
jgi:hypothetical protein